MLNTSNTQNKQQYQSNKHNALHDIQKQATQNTPQQQYNTNKQTSNKNKQTRTPNKTTKITRTKQTRQNIDNTKQ